MFYLIIVILQSVSDCIEYYYQTKKDENYKQLLRKQSAIKRKKAFTKPNSAAIRQEEQQIKDEKTEEVAPQEGEIQASPSDVAMEMSTEIVKEEKVAEDSSDDNEAVPVSVGEGEGNYKLLRYQCSLFNGQNISLQNIRIKCRDDDYSIITPGLTTQKQGDLTSLSDDLKQGEVRKYLGNFR